MNDIDFSKMCDQNAEEEINLKVTREKINEIFDLYGINLNDIDEKTLLPKVLARILDKDKDSLIEFNNAISKMHQNKELNIIEAALVLTTDWIEPSELETKILDPINSYILRNEMKKYYGLKKSNKSKLNK
jgi:hypothetical protein